MGMETNALKEQIIDKLVERGYILEQAEGFIEALQDSDLARQVNELTNITLGVVVADVASDLLM